MIAYADDFVVTAASKELLENKVKPILEERLAKIGLQLSKTKTKITHINEGFNFLPTALFATFWLEPLINNPSIYGGMIHIHTTFR